MTKPSFDIEAALQALRDGKDLTGKDGILTPLIKQLTEAAMQAELEQHLAQDETTNRKNGSTSKTIKSIAGRDELERKIIGLFALGTSYQDIRAHIEELYGIHLSNGTL